MKQKYYGLEREYEFCQNGKGETLHWTKRGRFSIEIGVSATDEKSSFRWDLVMLLMEALGLSFFQSRWKDSVLGGGPTYLALFVRETVVSSAAPHPRLLTEESILSLHGQTFLFPWWLSSLSLFPSQTTSQSWEWEKDNCLRWEITLCQEWNFHQEKEGLLRQMWTLLQEAEGDNSLRCKIKSPSILYAQSIW